MYRQRYSSTLNFGWVFTLAAFLVMVFGMEIVWWHALLVLLLASCSFTITYS